MGVDISISYRKAASDQSVRLEFDYCYSTLGGLSQSRQFWSIPRIRQLGIERLAMLGEASPVFFWGWDEVALLGQELAILSNNLSTIEFDSATKARWLANLTFCYHLLSEVAPGDSVPVVCLG